MAVAKLVADFTYTNAELLALWREADARLAAGAEEVQVLGKRYRKANADQITRKIAHYQALVDAADSTRSRKTYGTFRRDPP